MDNESNSVVLARGHLEAERLLEPSADLGSVAAKQPTMHMGAPSLSEVDRMGELLFERWDESDPLDALRAGIPDVAHYYAAGVWQAVDRQIEETVRHRRRLYLKGEVPGVGTSFAMADVARAFNSRMEGAGQPYQILYVPLNHGITSYNKLLDALSQYARSPLTSSELRHRSTTSMAQRLLAALHAGRVVTLILDHVHKLSNPVKGLVADLLLLTDPAYVVPERREDYARLHPRIGIILVSNEPATKVFARTPEVLRRLDGRHAVLPRYRTAVQVADAMRQARIGLDDLDLSVVEDALIAELVLAFTRGIPDQMTPVFGLMKAVARMQGWDRPTLACLHAALEYHRHLREHLVGRADPQLDGPEGVRLLARAQRTAAGIGHTEVPENDPEPSTNEPESGRPGKARRSTKRRDAHQTKHLAEQEHEALKRKGTVSGKGARGGK